MLTPRARGRTAALRLAITLLFLFVTATAAVAHDHHGSLDAVGHPCVACQLIGAPADLSPDPCDPNIFAPAAKKIGRPPVEEVFRPAPAPDASCCPLRGPPTH